VAPRKVGRVQPCDAAQARARLRDAQAQMELAELAQPASSPEERKAAVSCAVLAGIDATDAACCAALGERSRSQTHQDAADLLRQIQPGGAAAARQFERLIALKDAAQYGFEDLGGQALLAAQRQATTLITFAEQVLSR
jgi:hypothetical protein